MNQLKIKLLKLKEPNHKRKHGTLWYWNQGNLSNLNPDKNTLYLLVKTDPQTDKYQMVALTENKDNENTGTVMTDKPRTYERTIQCYLPAYGTWELSQD